MEVVFGLHLDGLVSPETVNGQIGAFNSAIAGSSALLGLLESRLGLNCPPANRTMRVAHYLRLMNEAPARHFFSASLETDPWATADYVLSLRDELLASGWDKGSIAGLKRIESLAKVEANEQIQDGFGERLQRVNKHLAEEKFSPLEKLKLVQAVSTFPALWRETIELLNKLGCEIDEIPLTGKSTDRDSDLFKLQERLCSPERNERLKLKGDGSIAVLDANDELQAAIFTAAWLSNNNSEQKKLVIIRGADCSLLAEAGRRFALPSIGNTARSQLKAALQILPLSFKLACRPVDPINIVEFLRLPEAPLPEWVSRELINAIASAPGMDGADWNNAWHTCLNKQRDWLLKDNPAISKDEASFKAKERLEPYKVWFAKLVPAGKNSISKEDSVAICERIEKWAGSKSKTTEELSIHEICAGQARLLKQLLNSQPGEQIPLAQLNKMIEAVLPYGVSMTGAEAADWSIVDKPGQIWSTAAQVLWWGFAQTDWSVPRKSTWTELEINTLRENGVFIDSLSEKLKRESFSWKMPVLNAAEKLVLVKPKTVAGQRAVPHPLWDEIASLLEESSIKTISMNAREIFSAEKLSFAQTQIACLETNSGPLPEPLRTWQVPAGIIKARKTESFSSIDKLLGCGLAWVLQYGGGMWEPRALNLPQKQILIGRVAHELVNEMYKKKKQWDENEARQYASKRIHELIPEIAATLLMPGARPQLKEATEAIPASIQQLAAFLNNSGAEVEDTEISLSAPLNDKTKLTGNVDMLLRIPSNSRAANSRAANSRAVLDFKWSSSPYFYRKKIVEGKAVQLAIYSWLAQQTDTTAEQQNSNVLQLFKHVQKPLAPAGFFMFRQGELFFTAEGVFPDFTLIRKMERDLDDTWKLTLEAYERELATLQSGKIVASGIIDHEQIGLEDFMHPSLVDPPCNFCQFSHLCGLTELK